MNWDTCQIKVWVPDLKKFYQLTRIDYVNRDCFFVKEDDTLQTIKFDDKDVIFCRSTGKHDSKKKLVFEGDIVRGIFSSYKPQLGIILWNRLSHGWVINPIMGRSPYNGKYYKLSGKKLEIVGNINSPKDILILNLKGEINVTNFS